MNENVFSHRTPIFFLHIRFQIHRPPPRSSFRWAHQDYQECLRLPPLVAIFIWAAVIRRKYLSFPRRRRRRRTTLHSIRLISLERRFSLEEFRRSNPIDIE